ncbi:hypothetical protein AB0M47_16035 [Hamadaea sp. NPDC051192]|uniref:hypothetical protein n=1 Tax=Hamadaea sp. NPDC051192 TaxID=3154940 RepID=UPI00342DCCB8
MREPIMPRPCAALVRWWRTRGVRVSGGIILSDRLWKGWLAAYAAADARTVDQPALRCPGCRSLGLRLVYTGGDNLMGFASMWCPGCRTGIWTCRSGIPADAPRLSWDMPSEQRDQIIDDFQAVHSRHDEPTLRRWTNHGAAILGLGLAVVGVLGLGTALLGPPEVARFLLTKAMPAMFTAFGIVSAISLAQRWLDRDVDPAHPLGRFGWRRKIPATRIVTGPDGIRRIVE